MRLSIIGITLSGLLAVVSMDYQYKAKSAGKQIGEYTLLDYAATLKQQYANLQNKRAGVPIHDTAQEAPPTTGNGNSGVDPTIQQTDASQPDLIRHTAAGFTSECWIQDGRKRCRIKAVEE